MFGLGKSQHEEPKTQAGQKALRGNTMEILHVRSGRSAAPSVLQGAEHVQTKFGNKKIASIVVLCKDQPSGGSTGIVREEFGSVDYLKAWVNSSDSRSKQITRAWVELTL